MSTTTSPETSLEATTAKVEGVVNALAPLAALAGPDGATAVAGLGAAETVAGAVEGNLAHHTALSDIAVGLQALAGTPLVTSNPTVAAKTSEFATLFGEFVDFFKGLAIKL